MPNSGAKRLISTSIESHNGEDAGWCGMMWDDAGWYGMMRDDGGWWGMMRDDAGWCGIMWDDGGWCGMMPPKLWCMKVNICCCVCWAKEPFWFPLTHREVQPWPQSDTDWVKNTPFSVSIHKNTWTRIEFKSSHHKKKWISAESVANKNVCQTIDCGDTPETMRRWSHLPGSGSMQEVMWRIFQTVRTME
jgi:hypothetical protein